MIYTLNCIRYAFLFRFWKTGWGGGGKKHNSIVKNIYSHGSSVQSLEKDQIMIRLGSIGILTFLKKSMWNNFENVCMFKLWKNTAWIYILLLTAPCCFGHLSCFSTSFEEEKADWSTSYISSPILVLFVIMDFPIFLIIFFFLWFAFLRVLSSSAWHSSSAQLQPFPWPKSQCHSVGWQFANKTYP